MAPGFIPVALTVLAVTTTPATHSQEAKVLRPAAIEDSAMGIERSHTLLLPEGWQVNGGALWTPNETAISHLLLDITAPNGSGVTFHRSGNAAVSESNMPQAQAAPGATRLRPDSTVGDVAIEQVLKRTRRGARGFRVVETTSVKSMRSVYVDLFGATARQMEINGTQAIGGDRTKTNVTLDVPSVKVTYRQSGETWEEEVLFYLMTVETRNDSSIGAWYSTKVWHCTSPVSIRAKKGTLEDERSLLYTVMGSVQPTRAWSEMRHMMNVAVARARHAAAMRTLEQHRRTAQEIARSDSRVREEAAASWKRQDAARDAGQSALVDAVAGVEQYRMPDGSTMALDAGYERAYTDGNGTILLTDDVLNDPNVGGDVDWKPIPVIK